MNFWGEVKLQKMLDSKRGDSVDAIFWEQSFSLDALSTIVF